MVFHVLTLFPNIVRDAAGDSILGKAVDKGIVELNLVDIRDFATDKHKMVDDYPYGGGPGMVMKPEPLYSAIESLELPAGVPLILLTPQGEIFDHRMATELADQPAVALICGRYEGIDERVREGLDVREVSIGDFVLTGGEFAALVIIDATARQIPGVLGDKDSPVDESFATGMLEHPQYTRPAEFRDMKVPDVLLSGDHARIARWRREQSLLRTYHQRPDLLEGMELTDEDQEFLNLAKKGKSD